MAVTKMLGVLACCAALTTLAGCGGGGNGSESPVASDSPRCSDLWVAGQSLPDDYDGCLSDGQKIVAAVKTNCSDGSELTTYDDRYWAIVGEEIKDTGSTGGTDTDPDFASAMKSCEG